MNIQVTLEQRVQLRLSQVISLAKFLSVPDEVLNAVANAIAFNPGTIESTLQERRRNSGDSYPSSGIQTIYSSLASDSGSYGPARSGMIVTPDLRSIEGCLGNYQTIITPDVVYIARKREKPEVVFSDHLNGTMNLALLQIDADIYPETAKLLVQIRRHDQWKRNVLKDSYVFIGEVQREYFEDFDRPKFNIFSQKELADKLNLSHSTVSRLISNRLVEARNLVGAKQVIYAKDLLVTKDDLKRFIVSPEINKALEEEFARKEAFSDQEIAKRAKHIARRTVTKYRLESNVPNARERNIAYQTGNVTAPYQLP
ncbi:MAG: hypothetical protein AABW41_04845 [Nanoarchaeota archaeon]